MAGLRVSATAGRPRHADAESDVGTAELEALAAVQAIGAALLSPDLFAQFIEQGKLVAPFASTVEGPSSYWLLWTKECADVNFLSWMKSQFGIA